MKNSNEIPWPYLAGLIDGEGSIQIYKHRGTYEYRLKIGNTDLRLMQWLISNVGGKYYTETNRNKDKHKTLHQWRTTGINNTKKVLEEVVPFLVLKQEQAKILLKYFEAESTKGRELLYLKLIPLNKRGVKV
jgi:hypothetical protein